MALHGIDVSSYNGSVDWPKVRAHNTFGICKATEGQGWRDPTFTKARWKAMGDAHMIRGAYHFARPSGTDWAADAKGEAHDFVTAAKSVGWSTVKDLPLILDCEATRLSPKDTLGWCDTFAGYVKRVTGRGCILYTGHWFWSGNLHLTRPPKNANVLWFSAYTSRVQMKQLLAAMRGYKPYLWQYTSSATVAGVDGKVDRNVALVSDSKFKELIHR